MAIYVPKIRNYAPFYIQKDGDALATDIQEVFGITILAQKVPLQRKVKAPYKNEFKDRNGDDEYTTALRYEAFTYTLKGCILTEESTSDAARSAIYAQVVAFQNFLANGSFKFYSAWTKFGFQKVRIDEFPEPDDNAFRNFDGHCRLIFSFTVKVNDPATRIACEVNDNPGRYKCPECGYVYDPAVGDPNRGVPAGTAWEDIPAAWTCPVCDTDKDFFEPYTEKDVKLVQEVTSA